MWNYFFPALIILLIGMIVVQIPDIIRLFKESDAEQERSKEAMRFGRENNNE